MWRLRGHVACQLHHCVFFSSSTQTTLLLVSKNMGVVFQTQRNSHERINLPFREPEIYKHIRLRFTRTFMNLQLLPSRISITSYFHIPSIPLLVSHLFHNARPRGMHCFHSCRKLSIPIFELFLYNCDSPIKHQS